MAMSTSNINRALMRCAKRAEKIDPDRLVDTFVQEGSLSAVAGPARRMR
jgi:hypothetical protein